MGKRKEAEFVQWLGPILDALRDLGGSGKPREVSSWIAEKLNISDDVLNLTLNSGESRFHNQVAWARQYLIWENYLDKNIRGAWVLTTTGRDKKLTIEESKLIVKKWVSIFTKARKNGAKPEVSDIKEDISLDIINDDNLNLLNVLQSLSPKGFENICKLLLRESGFEKVEVTGQSHDGGIDGYGTLELNPFVSFKVLFQCKRYKGGVSRAQVGDFRNAMIGRAEKGIIITTGHFTKEAINEANREGAPKVELVDGEQLVKMFEKVELGVKAKTVYEIDYSFFEPFL
ncbi:restriction endonuclease [uncultured Mucilaginibacter sp.]|uniref:restriction endonuclease n=1 Tax=uncultured Mucilaginibacter sp. TaxID=797541 RepID=UPI0025E0B1F2|nr:restriction endonuclease [uncultured Mucilaginibacter sp.]